METDQVESSVGGTPPDIHGAPPTRRRRRRASTVILALAAVTVLAAGAYAWASGGQPTGSSWVRVLHEDFEHDLDRNLWNTCHWWNDGGCTIASNQELQWYLPSSAVVDGGRLDLIADERPATGPDGTTYPYTSGMVSTGPATQDQAPRFDFTYGRVEARLRVPAGAGLWSAFWLLPSSTESRPEIDMVEVLGNDPSEWIFHLHPKDRSRDSEGTRLRGPDLSNGWHDVRVDWEPGRIRWFIDGDQAWEVLGDQVPDEPMYLVLNLAVGGDYPGSPTSATTFPATMQVEHVSVWQRSDGP